VELRFGDEWAGAGPRAIEGRLELEQRVEGTTAVVEGVAGTVVLSVRPGAALEGALVVDDDRQRASVPVTIEVTGCSAHALIESKKTYRFPAWVALDGAEAVRVELEPKGPARAAMEALLAACQAAATGADG